MPQYVDSPAVIRDSFIIRTQKLPVCQKINAFLMSPAYLFLVGGLTVISSCFSAELVVYSCFILCALYLCICGKDFLPLMPLVICCYIAPSIGNNPGLNENSIFFPGHGGIYLFCLAGLLCVCIILRLCLDPEFGRKSFLFCRRKLLLGMLILGGAYLLSGAFSGHYFDNGFRNTLFGFIQFISVFLMYFLFTGGVKWQEAPRNYLAWTGICVGCVLLCQILHIYIINDVIINGEIQRDRIFSGWGNYNNIGALLTMTIPFSFQQACTHKKGWPYLLCALGFLVGVVLTCSRGSIGAALIIYLLSYSIAIYQKGLRAKSSCLVHLITFLPIAALLLLFHDELYHLFRVLFSQGLNPSNRENIYIEGLKQFGKYPIFGGTFYPLDFPLFDFSNVEAFSSFFPPRWHNTIIQLLASCGIVGLLAYGFHRYQVIRLFVTTPTPEKAFIGLFVLALLITSMLDNHFFNVGPTLFYSMALAFAEKTGRKEPV